MLMEIFSMLIGKPDTPSILESLDSAWD